jgi:hypothetical protein
MEHLLKGKRRRWIKPDNAEKRIGEEKVDHDVEKSGKDSRRRLILLEKLFGEIRIGEEEKNGKGRDKKKEPFCRQRFPGGENERDLWWKGWKCGEESDERASDCCQGNSKDKLKRKGLLEVRKFKPFR